MGSFNPFVCWLSSTLRKRLVGILRRRLWKRWRQSAARFMFLRTTEYALGNRFPVRQAKRTLVTQPIGGEDATGVVGTHEVYGPALTLIPRAGPPGRTMSGAI